MDGNKPHQELGKDRAKARFLFVFFSLQQGDPPTDKGGWHGPNCSGYSDRVALAQDLVSTLTDICDGGAEHPEVVLACRIG